MQKCKKEKPFPTLKLPLDWVYIFLVFCWTYINMHFLIKGIILCVLNIVYFSTQIIHHDHLSMSIIQNYLILFDDCIILPCLGIPNQFPIDGHLGQLMFLFS